MEAAGLALSVTQTLFAALQCTELRELFSAWGYESQLEGLHESVEAIRAMLVDVDTKQAYGLELSASELNLIEKVKDALYDADDLLDEYATRARLQQLRVESSSSKISKKVRRFVHRMTDLKVAYFSSPQVKHTANKLAKIAQDAKNFKVDLPSVRRTPQETCSRVNEISIIGRDEDKEIILDKLLGPKALAQDFEVIAIVGMGGLGKTALAQLVYNDSNIQNAFSRRLWVCVSDQDQNQFNVTAILSNVLKSLDKTHSGGLNLEQLCTELSKKLLQHKYLLVLDDLWTENKNKWLELRDKLLTFGEKESKIVVTTRSKRTALAVGSSYVHSLRGLSDQNSWRLFQMMVGEEQANSNDFFEMGKDIVKKCVNVPLAIRVMGSLLSNQSLHTWKAVQQAGINEIEEDKNSIMPILKFSYYHLSASLKSCYTYCALFPKDYKIRKKVLLQLWMAHDYIEPLYKDQPIEEAAQEYFQILVHRCFFQDIEFGDCEDLTTFKIHDLMHDIAQQVAGKEILVADFSTDNPGIKVRHINDWAFDDRGKGFITGGKVRTYIKESPPFCCNHNLQFPLSTLLTNWGSLRALDLSHLNVEWLPDVIGKLIHLRYLNLSENNALKALPKSFTKLINLKFLNLDLCPNLKELPNDFHKLLNLTTLHVCHDYGYFKDEEYGLRCMPQGIDRLTCLIDLNRFIVGQRVSNLKQHVAGLESLRPLTNLKGCLQIDFAEGYYDHVDQVSGGEEGCLCNKHLDVVRIRWPKRISEDREIEEKLCAANMLECLRPHEKITYLNIEWYRGMRIPKWATADNLATSLPHLNCIEIYHCPGLVELPWFGKLPSLKTLYIWDLPDLECMEDGPSSTLTETKLTRSAEITDLSMFFPSLKVLWLRDLPKLKGWWRNCSTLGCGPPGSSITDGMMVKSDSNVQISRVGYLVPSFPCLSELTMTSCPNITTIPPCPTVEILTLTDCNPNLKIMIKEEKGPKKDSAIDDSGSWSHPKIRNLSIDNVKNLNSLPMVAFERVTNMTIRHDDLVVSLSEYEEVFRARCISLQRLNIYGCNSLRSVAGGLKYLTALEFLSLNNLSQLRYDETSAKEKDDTWICLSQCLHSLELLNLNMVKELPNGMSCLAALQSLYIFNLPLKDLPEWIGCLSSLQILHISDCKCLEVLPEAMSKLTSLKSLKLVTCNPILHKRCKQPDGKYWHRIQHIKSIMNMY